MGGPQPPSDALEALVSRAHPGRTAAGSGRTWALRPHLQGVGGPGPTRQSGSVGGRQVWTLLGDPSIVTMLEPRVQMGLPQETRTARQRALGPELPSVLSCCRWSPDVGQHRHQRAPPRLCQPWGCCRHPLRTEG